MASWAGQQGQTNRFAAVGGRNTGPRQRRDAGGHARHHLERNAFSAGQDLGLLASAAEDVGVTALEPHHPLALPRQSNQQRVDLLLRHRVVAGDLADRVKLDIAGRSQGKAPTPRADRRPRHRLRCQTLPTTNRHQARDSPGRCTDQGDETRRSAQSPHVVRGLDRPRFFGGLAVVSVIHIGVKPLLFLVFGRDSCLQSFDHRLSSRKKRVVELALTVDRVETRFTARRYRAAASSHSAHLGTESTSFEQSPQPTPPRTAPRPWNSRAICKGPRRTRAGRWKTADLRIIGDVAPDAPLLGLAKNLLVDLAVIGGRDDQRQVGNRGDRRTDRPGVGRSRLWPPSSPPGPAATSRDDGDARAFLDEAWILRRATPPPPPTTRQRRPF